MRQIPVQEERTLMSAAYIRNYYGVPAKRGGRVITHHGPGTITSFHIQCIRIRLDDPSKRTSAPWHPTWCMRYLDTHGNVIHGTPCEQCAERENTMTPTTTGPMSSPTLAEVADAMDLDADELAVWLNELTRPRRT